MKRLSSESHLAARRKAALPPGTLVYLDERRVDKVTLSIIDYNETEFRETPVQDVETCRQYMNRNTVTWINVVGLHDADLLTKLGNIFGFHPLALEDIMQTGQRPKLEDHDSYIFFVMQMIYRRPGTEEIVSEQVSMILCEGCLFTFQEVEGDVFDMLRDRIRTGKGRVRKMGPDYLAYSILDAIVDNYFVALEELGEQSEILQEQIMENPEPETLHGMHRLRGNLIFLRKNAWPLRELVAALEKTENRLIVPKLAPYLRDVYEHIVQVIDTVESLRDVLSGALDIYITMTSNRTNEVMKVLTVIATIFIPLTFIAGVYGMNFEHMPELRWRHGYAAVWAAMAFIAAGMVLFFRRRKWF